MKIGIRRREQCCQPDWDYLIAERVGELGVNDLTIKEGDWEGSRRSWVGHVDTKTNCSHEGHSQYVEPRAFEPG